MNRQQPAVDDGWDLGPIGLCLILLAALVFGGANRVDVMAPIVPRLIAIALLAWALWTGSTGVRHWSPLEKLIWGLLFAVPLIQLVPLPYDVWTSLPGRDYPRDLFAALSMTPAEPVSMAPDRTINSLLALLPPFVAYMLARNSDRSFFGLIVRIIAVAALANALLGLLQMAAGSGALRPYAVTNPDLAVGLFANANHLGSLLVVGLFAIFAWLRDIGLATPGRDGNRIAIALVAGIPVILAALWFSNSRAAMLILAGFAVLAIIVTAAGRIGWDPARVLLALVGSALAATLLFLLFAPQATLSTLSAAMSSEDRVRNLPIFSKIIVDHFPFGSGVGSFDGVFKAYEPVEILNGTYLNHAHNDYAQLLIEAGSAAVAGLALFGLWWLRGAVAITRGIATDRGGDHGLDLFALAGTAVFMIHSLGEYPLRTAANGVIFAILCARIAQSRARAIPV